MSILRSNSRACVSISANVRETSPDVPKIAPTSLLRASVSPQLLSNASSDDFISCENSLSSYLLRSFSKMEADIHPEYFDTDIEFAGGAVYHTRSTRRDIKVGISAACHPFSTGDQKVFDASARFVNL